MAKVIGTDVYLEVDVGTSTPDWKKIGGQRGASLSFSLEAIDLTDKDNSGWADTLPSIRSVELSCDALLIEDDQGFAELKKGFFDKQKLKLRITTPTKRYTGEWYLTELSLESPHDDAATISCSFKNAGAISEENVTP